MINKEIFMHCVGEYLKESNARTDLENLLGGIVIETDLFAFSNFAPNILALLIGLEEKTEIVDFVNMFYELEFGNNIQLKDIETDKITLITSFEELYDFWKEIIEGSLN